MLLQDWEETLPSTGVRFGTLISASLSHQKAALREGGTAGVWPFKSAGLYLSQNCLRLPLPLSGSWQTADYSGQEGRKMNIFLLRDTVSLFDGLFISTFKLILPQMVKLASPTNLQA